MTVATLAPTALAPHSAAALALLDDPQEWGAFSRADRHDPVQWESSVVIEGMHCAACSLTVEDALRQVPGVLSAQVSAASQRARVVWSSAVVQPSGWMQAVQQAGYRAVPANDVFASERRRKASRQALWRWLVAGLCMMQVMMYAWPAYVAQPGDLTGEMEQLLRWASWVLTLPVILFSCGPFFKSALRDVAQLRISMDLPVALGMVITFAVSTAGTFDPQGIFGREVYFDSLTMFVFFLLTGRWLELRLRDRTAGALEALMNRLPDSVERQTARGDFERVAVRRLVPGDLVRVLPGEAFA
ncbi:MAG: cation transporter, partial [Burkholderiaceae bacterium]|nr:cation transporter [Burkholderiaceae bacterium]